MSKIDVNRVIQRFLRLLERRWNPPKRRLQVEDPVKKLAKSAQEAARGLVDPAALKTWAHKNRVVTGQKYDGVHPDLVIFYKAFQKEMDGRNIPVYPFEFIRSGERQRQLLAQKRTRAGPGASPHNYGLAVDVVSSIKFWDLTPLQWEVVGAIGKEVARKTGIAVEWGGDWDFYDPAHWQIAEWKRWREFRLGESWPEGKTHGERAEYRRQFRHWKKTRGLG